MNSFSFVRKVYFVVALLFCCVHANAKNWQVMLIPSAQTLPENTGTPLNKTPVEPLAPSYSIMRTELEAALLKDLNRVISPSRVFESCERSLCGADSKKALVQAVQTGVPELELLIVFALSEGTDHDSSFIMSAELIDPLSFQILHSLQIPILSSGQTKPSQAAIKSISADLGSLIARTLKQKNREQQFKLTLEGFTLDEIAPLSTYVLTRTQNVDMRLIRSQKKDGLLSNMFPIMQTQFSVATRMTPAQFNLLIMEYFSQQDIDVVSEYQRDTAIFSLARIGNPYLPSFVSSIVLFLVLILILAMLVKRQMYHYRLASFADRKSVDQWLETYNSVSSPWYFLQRKWGKQLGYWQRLQRESNDLSKQAKIFYEAGDVTTAKLFISKSLNLNNDDKQARKLLSKIEEHAQSKMDLNEKEQAARNKVAKAVNNYRANKPLKALRQAYQALAEIADEKQLKRQHKAVKRLIKKLNYECSQHQSSLFFTGMGNSETVLITRSPRLQIGRYANNTSELMVIGEDKSIFELNHKALSRLGKQCVVFYQHSDHEHSACENSGFFIQDEGSTNGTFLNSKALEDECARPLNNGDTILLGDSSELKAVKLTCHIQASHQNLHLRVDTLMQQTVDLADLVKIWPDYIKAMQSSVLMTQTPLLLCFDSNEQKFTWLSEDSLQSRTHLHALLLLSLGESASISPVLQEANSDANIEVNGELLLGKVPLILPCEIKWQERRVRLEHASYRKRV
uniref:FHA domain-containing protein n=1 Tax=Ningiella ruwaisensis TaxID=2364274 RepID=UPI001448A270|nr:FHA domain-containing protein [Ningiella ruwaisensis]